MFSQPDATDTNTVIWFMVPRHTYR